MSILVSFVVLPGNAAAVDYTAAEPQVAECAALTPSEALEYMIKTPNLYILDLSPRERFLELHFDGAVNIPSNEIVSRINEIPKGSTVIMNCRLGRTVVKFYPLVRRMRPDLNKVFYINDTPFFEEYNARKRGK
jgi:chlorite dismutase